MQLQYEQNVRFWDRLPTIATALLGFWFWQIIDSMLLFKNASHGGGLCCNKIIVGIDLNLNEILLYNAWITFVIFGVSVIVGIIECCRDFGIWIGIPIGITYIVYIIYDVIRIIISLTIQYSDGCDYRGVMNGLTIFKMVIYFTLICISLFMLCHFLFDKLRKK